MAIYKGELQTDKKDLLYPHTSSDVVFGEDGVSVAEQLEKVKQDVKKIDTSWNGISGRPETFPPSPHTHDDRYYTETEIDNSVMKINEYGNGVFGNNLNDWKKAGSWMCTSSTTNVPVGDGWGTVLIYGQGDRLNQIFNAWNHSPHVKYIRNLNAGTWSKWEPLSTSNHTHSYLTGGRDDKIDVATGNDCAGLHTKNNVDIQSWYGVSFSNSCPAEGIIGRPTASIDVRWGILHLENDVRLGGISLKSKLAEMEKKLGGDYVGKQLLPIGRQAMPSGQTFTYSNSKGGVMRVTFPGGYLRYSVTVDNALLVSNREVSDFANTIAMDEGNGNSYRYELMIPFENTVKLTNHQPSGTHYIVPVVYVNK